MNHIHVYVLSLISISNTKWIL